MEDSKVNQQPTDIKKFGKKQQLILLISVFSIVIVAITLAVFGFFSTKKDVAKNSEENKIQNLKVPQANNKDLETNKYKDYTNPTLDNGERLDNLKNFVGEEPKFQAQSNENLTEKDIRSQSLPFVKQSPSQKKKENMNYKFQQQQQMNVELQNSYLQEKKTLYRKSREDIEEEKIAKLEKEQNLRTANLVLENLEKVNKQSTVQNTQQNNFNPNEPFKIKREEVPLLPKPEEAVLHPEVHPNTIGKPFKKGFYNLSTKVKESYTPNQTIEAVIHGQGDGIVVKDGALVKVRLLENTILNINKNDISLTAGTFLTGIASISNDRVYINIKTIAIGNNLLPTNISVFDIDGQLGLYVPNLGDKNILAQDMLTAGSSPFNSSSLFIPSGSIKNQVGTQIALQATQSILQGAKSLARTKVGKTKVSIKPNYKVLLKTGNN